jgi:hypothetical protein
VFFVFVSDCHNKCFETFRPSLSESAVTADETETLTD